MKKLIYSLLFLICFLPLYQIHAQAATQYRTIVADKTGRSDSSDVIQKALDLARDNPNNYYVITLPAGTYRINDTLKIYSNTNLKMYGATIVRYSNSSMMRFGRLAELDACGGYSGYNGFCNITIEGGCFNGNGKANPSYDSALLRFAHANNVTIKNMTFTNISNGHHLEFAGSKNVKIQNCTFSDFTGTRSAYTEAVQMDIMSSIGDHFTNYDKFDGTPCENVTISGCKFTNVQCGVGTHSGIVGSYFNNIRIESNSFSNVSRYAIIATNFKNSYIGKNTIVNAGSGISFQHMLKSGANYYSGNTKAVNCSLNCVIENNTIEVLKKGMNTTVYGISLNGEVLTKNVVNSEKQVISKGDYRVGKVSVRNNTISLKNCGYGIWLQGTKQSSIANNKITINIPTSAAAKGNGDGIRITDSASNSITSNKIVNQGKSNSKSKEQCGIVSESSTSNTIKSNSITGSIKNGIHLFGKSTATLSKNTISNSGKYGVQALDSSNLTLTSNTISSSAKDAIRFSGKSKGTVTSNKISKSNGYGIEATEGSTLTVTKNTVSTSKLCGIYFAGKSSGTITSNKVSSSSKNGIQVSGSSKATVSKNTITSSGKNGIHFSEKSTGKITQNTISKSKKYGIQTTSGSKATISKNKIKSSGSKNIQPK